MLTENIHRKSGIWRSEERLRRRDFKQDVVMVNLTPSVSFQ